MPFADFIVAKKKLSAFLYVTAVPFSAVGLFGSSFFFAYQYPNLFNPQEELQPILYVTVHRYPSLCVAECLVSHSSHSISSLTHSGFDPMFVAATSGTVSALISYMLGVVLLRKVWEKFNKSKALAIRMVSWTRF